MLSKEKTPQLSWGPSLSTGLTTRNRFLLPRPTEEAYWPFRRIESQATESDVG